MEVDDFRSGLMLYQLRKLEAVAQRTITGKLSLRRAGKRIDNRHTDKSKPMSKYPFARVVISGQRRQTALHSGLEIGTGPSSATVVVMHTI
jgi:hypothetical protein